MESQSRDAVTSVKVSRLRAVLRDTFAQFGYARVPEPPDAPQESRELLIRELMRELEANRDRLGHAHSRAEFARLLDDVFRATNDKLARDRAWADEYAKHGIRDDAFIGAAAKSAADAWRDL
jgi:hypothetical protein